MPVKKQFHAICGYVLRCQTESTRYGNQEARERSYHVGGRFALQLSPRLRRMAFHALLQP